jgi:adenylate kinase
VEELAVEHQAGYESDDGFVVDMEMLASRLGGVEDEGYIVGHLAHLLPNGLCIVLRAHPGLIIERLKARGYVDEKVMANAEAEAIDLILIEALDGCQDVREIDCSEMSGEDVAAAIERIIDGQDGAYAPGNVDWSEVVLSWY